MKNLKFVIATLASAIFAISCQDDGGDSKINFIEGATPNIVKTTNTVAVLDFVSINNDNTLNMSVTVDKGFGEISSMDIVGFYTKGTTVEKVVLKSDITSFPSTYNFTQNDLINSFSLLNSKSDFIVGDNFKISTEMVLNNGSRIKMFDDKGIAIYGPDIRNSNKFKVVQTYNVACISNLAGTYNVLSSGTSTDTGPTAAENPITSHPYVVTITSNGGGEYTLSDGYGGLYLLWYDIYGITGNEPGSFKDVCGTLSGKFKEPFGTDVILTGTVNSDGTLSMHWENGYGDFGDSVYTKK
jgi:hypothetical protein